MEFELFSYDLNKKYNSKLFSYLKIPKIDNNIFFKLYSLKSKLIKGNSDFHFRCQAKYIRKIKY